jgi:transposase
MPTHRRKLGFQQELPGELERAALAYATAHVELWAEDEHRIGLKPILRKVWAKRGRRPIAVIRPRYQWLYVVAFVHPETGRTIWWTVSGLDAEVFSALLAAFAQELGLGANRRVLLVLDGAGWHTGEEVRCPPGVELLVQPAYSPELQPAEHLWALCDGVLVNRCFETLDELQAVLAPHLVHLTQQLQRIRSLTLFHWWPTTGPPSV